MKLLTRLILIFVVILTLSSISLAQNNKASDNQPAPENDPNSWKEFSSTEGGFSALFPGIPKEERKQVPTPDGNNASMNTFTVRTMGEYGITYADYPWSIEGTERETKFLDAVMYDGVKGFGGTLLEYKEISFEGHPGREYRLEFGGGYNLKSRIFVVKNRLYMIAATTYGKKAPAQVARIYENSTTRFFDSFKLITSSSEVLGEVDRLLQDEKIKAIGFYYAPPDSPGIFQDKAVSLPKPAYPPVAKAARITGTVAVKVLLDEDGKVMAAQAESDHPLLQAAAVAAARQARFPQTFLEGKPVKIVGIITYNFIL